MKARFYYESEEVKISVQLPFANDQNRLFYQKWYPNAVLEELREVEPSWKRLCKIVEKQKIRLKDDRAFNILQFLDRHLSCLCESETRLYGAVLEKAQTIQEALELSVNLDCYQISRIGRVRQIKEHGYRYQKGSELPPVGMTGRYQVMAGVKMSKCNTWLFLPMTEEKKRSVEKRLGVESLEQMRAKLIELEEDHLERYLPEEGTVKELEQFAQALEERKNFQKADWETVYAALLIEQPENFREICEVLEKSASYYLTPEQTKPTQHKTPFGYLELNGALPLHPLSEEIVTSWIYGNLCGELTENSYEMEEPDVEMLYGDGLVKYEEEIQAQVKLDEAYGREDGGLAKYLYNALLREKICGIEVCVAEIAGELWSKTKIESYGPLSDTQTAQVKQYLSGLFSASWGKGLEQREIDLGREKLCLYFWHLKMNNDLYTEEELQEVLDIELSMSLG